MYKGLITEPMPLFEEEKRKYYNGIIDVVVAEKTNENYLIDRIADFDVLQVVYAKVTKSIIEAKKKLKVIARYGIGTDNIDVATATKLSIPVVYAPEYHIPSVPEHILALIFTLARRIPEANQSVKSGEWNYKKFCGIDIEDKVLGIIGLGRIGKSLAKKAIALGMKVIGYDPYLSDNKAIKEKIVMKSLEEIIKESDFLVLCIPLTSETKGFINKNIFA